MTNQAPIEPQIQAERQRRLRVRNLAVLAALVAFSLLVYLVSIIKMQINP
jgi:hypothetical protein